MKFPFDDIHDRMKDNDGSLIGREVYIMTDNSATSINDLVLVTVQEVVSKGHDEQGIVVRGINKYINRNLEEEEREYKGHAIYLVIGENKVMTSKGPMFIVAQCDDFGPYFELMKKQDMNGKYYANAVFRYRGIFFFFKITGNYLFATEDNLIDFVEELDMLYAEITKKGIIIKIFGEQILIKKYEISVDKKIYTEPRHKELTWEAICKNEGISIDSNEKIELRFRRYMLKYL